MPGIGKCRQLLGADDSVTDEQIRALVAVLEALADAALEACPASAPEDPAAEDVER